MPSDFFGVLEHHVKYITFMIYLGEPLSRILKTVRRLRWHLGGSEDLVYFLTQKAYEAWWKSSKDFFIVDVVEELACGTSRYPSSRTVAVK
jgi:hypothetical protein